MHSLMLFAFSLASLPSFDGKAAILVGAVVFVAAAAAITVAILIPGVPILAGAGLWATFKAVAIVSMAVGIIGGTAAGFYRGYESDKKREATVEWIRTVSNQLDVHFQASASTPDRAEDFRCCLVLYDETDMTTRQPTIQPRKINIEAKDVEEFYSILQTQLAKWFAKKVLGDKEQHPRRVVIYMRPFPGDGVYERIKELCTSLSSQCVVNKVEGQWKSAIAVASE